MSEQPPPEKSRADEPRDARTDAEWAALAASLATQQEPRARASAAPAADAAPRGLPRGAFASSLAFVLALIAIGVAGMLWWQYRQFYVSLDETDTATELALERVRAELRALQDDLEDVTDNVDAGRRADASMSERLDALPSRFVELERRIDAAQGGSFDARAEWLRAEAEHYLQVANTELRLAGNWDNAIEALELADGRLAELADPAVGPVREAIAGEVLALRSVRLPDVEGLVFSLGRLAGRAEELPLRAELPVNYADRAEALEDAEPGLGRLWLSLRRTLLGLVRIERRDEPVAQALSAAERQLRRRQLEVELELARIAALRGQPQVFQSSLQAAIRLLREDFDADSAEVEGALALLSEMLELELEPPRPDISGSLALLRGLETRSE
jgi:uncharacterized protein HemX